MGSKLEQRNLVIHWLNFYESFMRLKEIVKNRLNRTIPFKLTILVHSNERVLVQPFPGNRDTRQRNEVTGSQVIGLIPSCIHHPQATTLLKPWMASRRGFGMQG